jgi:hypothetical protein
MNRVFALRSVIVALVVAGSSLLPSLASAGQRPHFSHGTAHFTPTGFVGEGQATHLGHYTEIGTVEFLDVTDPPFVPIQGSTTYTAASGDELDAVFTGHLNALTLEIEATLTYVGADSGRFEDATGSAKLTGRILPDGTIEVSVKGTIDY